MAKKYQTTEDWEAGFKESREMNGKKIQLQTIGIQTQCLPKNLHPRTFSKFQEAIDILKT